MLKRFAPIAIFKIVWVFLALAASCAAAYAQQAELPRLDGARVLSTPERARLILDMSAPAQFDITSGDEPDRIFVDVMVDGLSFEASRTVTEEGLIGEYEVQMAEAGRARATLYLSGPAQVQQAYVLDPFEGQPARLVVDLVPDSAERFALRARQDRAASQPEMAATPAQQQDQQQDPQQDPVPKSVETPPAPPVAQAQRAKRLIVIDPGHGGVDGGAEAPNGVKEKDIVLEFSLELQRLLVETGRFDVALTRDSDIFLRLEERVALARQNKADLFISVHADSFQEPDARGASLYTRDERAPDVLDKVLAENENRADLIAGFELPVSDANLVNTLVDLMRRDTRRQSYIAGKTLVDHLEPAVRLRRFPMRQADFFVLQAPEVPSVLLELGFLSNPDDIENLMQGEWRDRTAAALVRGITAYFDLRDRQGL